jgi:SAM-dependent methyltransferase
VGFEELKTKQAQVWGSGAFERVEETLIEMYEALLAGLEPGPGDRLLDVACGTGGLAVRAASAGAEVTGIDLAPELIETARRRAATAGAQISFEVGDCELLPYEDGSFDVVSSSVGAIFAPNHEVAAGQLARVCAPGGRLGLTSWRAEGGVGDFFRFMADWAPPPPEGAGLPLAWGREEYVEERLGEWFELEFTELDSVYEADSGESAWRLFSEGFGPTRAAAAALSEDERERFHQAFVEYFERYRTDGGGLRQSRTYLLTTGRRKS